VNSRSALPRLLVQSTNNVLRVSTNGLHTIDYLTQKHIETYQGGTDEEFDSSLIDINTP